MWFSWVCVLRWHSSEDASCAHQVRTGRVPVHLLNSQKPQELNSLYSRAGFFLEILFSRNHATRANAPRLRFPVCVSCSLLVSTAVFQFLSAAVSFLSLMTIPFSFSLSGALESGISFCLSVPEALFRVRSLVSRLFFV